MHKGENHTIIRFIYTATRKHQIKRAVYFRSVCYAHVKLDVSSTNVIKGENHTIKDIQRDLK
jgi:hypothetical protein